MIVELIAKPVRPTCYPNELWTGIIKEDKDGAYFRKIYLYNGYYRIDYNNATRISSEEKAAIEKYMDDCEQYTKQTGKEIFGEFVIVRQSRGKYRRKLRNLTHLNDDAPPLTPLVFRSRKQAEEYIDKFFSGMTKRQMLSWNRMIVTGVR